jgi:DNA-binding HxlR family transcriptional regulator
MAVPGQRIRDQFADQARLGDVYAPECPSRSLLDHVTSRWGVLVLVLLLERPHRFSELSATVLGVSDKMLSQTLKQLTADGFVRRLVADDQPVRVTYELTHSGREVATRLADLVEWLEANVGSTLAPAR